MLVGTMAPGARGWFSQTGPQFDVVLSSRVSLSRNIDGFPFPHRLDDAQRIDLRRTLDRALSGVEQEFFRLDGAGMNPEIRAFWRERGALPDSEANLGSAVSPDEVVLVRLAEDDHVRMSATLGGLALVAALENVRGLDSAMEAHLSYAATVDFGYLTADLNRSGSGLAGSVMLHLTALEQTEGLPYVLEDLAGARAELSRLATGDIPQAGLYVASLVATPQENEETALTELEGFVTSLVDYERAAREDIRVGAGIALTDACYRSFGVLSNARVLTLSEALEQGALLRTGVASGVVDAVSLSTATEVLFLAQDGQVRVLTGNESETLDERRADLVRRILKESNQ